MYQLSLPLMLTYFAFCVMVIYDSMEYNLPKSEWECTARDVRDNSCVEYGLIEFPKKVVYNDNN